MPKLHRHQRVEERECRHWREMPVFSGIVGLAVAAGNCRWFAGKNDLPSGGSEDELKRIFCYISCWSALSPTLSRSLSFRLSLCVCLCMSYSQFVCVYMRLSLSMSAFAFVYLSVCLHVCFQSRRRDSTPCRVGRSVGRSIRPSVPPSVTFLNSEHYGSCPTVRDWIAVYPALFHGQRPILAEIN